jgi:hypothetical protein
MAHLLVISKTRYLENLASGFENTVFFGQKMMFLHHRLLSFKDIENRSIPKDVPCKGAYFTYQALNCLINIGGLNWAVHIKKRQLLMW